MNIILAIKLIIVFCLLPVLAQAAMYVYVDQRGIAYYTNQPGEGRYKLQERTPRRAIEFPGEAWSRPLTPAQIFDKVKDSIVVVRTLDPKGNVKGQGSGVLLPSGQIATNFHVVKGGASFQVAQGERVIPATLFAEDKDKDICLIEAKGFKGKPVQLGTANSLKVGVPVYAVGAPRGLELSLSNGIVSQLRGGSPPLIQTTAAISPGSSGGGLFDEEGRLVGLTTLYLKDGQSLNFATPVDWISELKPGQRKATLGSSETKRLNRVVN
jgi:S1-C subfamily serine protease